MIFRIVLCTLANLIASVGPAFAQVPSALVHSIPAPPSGVQVEGKLGFSVAVDRGLSAIGAPFDNRGAADAGIVKVFDSVTGALLHVVGNPAPGSIDNFGHAVALSGTRLVVGVPFDDSTVADSGSVYVYDLAGPTPTTPVTILNNPTPAQTDNFGFSVAIDGSRVVVGGALDDTVATNSGTVYVYDLTGASPATPLATLKKPTPAVNDFFGSSVAVSGTRIVVGAYGDDTGATNAGSAYVFDLTSASPAVPVTVLHNPSPGGDDHFGWSVDIAGNYVAVGAPLDDTAAISAGSAYVYHLAGATPTQPILSLTKPSAISGDQFGHAVTVSDLRVVVGAYGDDAEQLDSGRAFVYEFSSATPTVPTATLNNPTSAFEDHFGWSVAISDTQVVIGADRDDSLSTDTGAAYGFDLASVTPNLPIAVFQDAGPGTGDQFGYSVAISEAYVVVGARVEDTGANNAGSAYVYGLGGTTPTTPIAVLNNPNPAADDNFGESVAISGTRVVVGAVRDDALETNEGSAYVYDFKNSAPGTPFLTLNNPGAAGADNFGHCVAIAAQWVAVGVPQDDAGAEDAGCVYIYDLSSGTPDVPVRTLTHPNPSAKAKFGTAVAISGTKLVVGAPYENTGATEAGRAYVYELGGGSPASPIATLNNPSPSAKDNFGYSVAISGNRVAVGAQKDSAGALETGTAYVFEVGTPTVLAATLNNPNPATNDAFGSSVAISGTRVIVGAVTDDNGASDTGAAYLYDLAGAIPAAPLAPLGKVNPRAGDRFGGAVAIEGTTVVVGALSDDTVMVDKGFVYVFGPDVVAPAGGTFSLSSVSPVKAGVTITANFGGWTDASNPLKYSLWIDGTEVVAPGTNAAPTFTFSEGSHLVRGRISDLAGNFTDTAEQTVVADATAPSITLGTSAPRTLIDGGSLPDYAAESTVTDVVGLASVTQSPPAGTVVTFPFNTQVKVVATDLAGHISTVVVPVLVRPAGAVRSVLVWNGGAVPKGGTDTRIQVGAVWTNLGAPAISDTGAVAFLGKWKASAVSGPSSLSAQLGAGIFIGDTLLVKVGEKVTGAGSGGLPVDATFKSLRDPVIDQGGRVAFIATIKGSGVHDGNDGVVMSSGRTGTLETIAREGTVAAGTGGAVFKSFANVSIRGAAVGGTLFTATLAAANGGSPVNGTNDLGAWWLPAGEASVTKLVRKGDAGFLSGETIKSFQILQSVSGSTGHGRGLVSGNRAVIQLSLTGGTFSRQVLATAAVGSLTDLASTGDPLGGIALPSAIWSTMFLPSSNPNGTNIAVLGALTAEVGGVSKSTVKAIMASDDSGETWEPLARVGTPAPAMGPDALFSALLDPVCSQRGIAFFGTAKGGTVSPRDNDAIWWKPAGGTLACLAREGGQPPGVSDGAKWKKFTSLVLPGGDTGPIFVASLSPGLTSTVERITAKNDVALYGVDQFGTLREMLREGQTIERKLVKSFSVFKAISGSAGATRSFNGARQVAALVSFTDGTTAIMKFELP